MTMIVLTVADHEKNGFIELAQWPGLDEAVALELIRTVDKTVTDDSEPDKENAPYWFILDLKNGNHDLVETSQRLLPTQVAMKLAPEQVQVWLNERPNPNRLLGRAVPSLSLTPFYH